MTSWRSGPLLVVALLAWPAQAAAVPEGDPQQTEWRRDDGRATDCCAGVRLAAGGFSGVTLRDRPLLATGYRLSLLAPIISRRYNTFSQFMLVGASISQWADADEVYFPIAIIVGYAIRTTGVTHFTFEFSTGHGPFTDRSTDTNGGISAYVTSIRAATMLDIDLGPRSNVQLRFGPYWSAFREDSAGRPVDTPNLEPIPFTHAIGAELGLAYRIGRTRGKRGTDGWDDVETRADEQALQFLEAPASSSRR